MLDKVWRKGDPSALLVGMYIGTTTIENGMEVPQKTKNKTKKTTKNRVAT